MIAPPRAFIWPAHAGDVVVAGPNHALRPGQCIAKQINQQSWMTGLGVFVAILVVIGIVTAIGPLS